MRKALLPLLLCAFPLFSDWDETDSYFYADLGALYFFNPAAGIGYRMQSGHQGLDFSARVSLGLLAQAKTSVIYLYYPTPYAESQFYLGVGASALYINIYGISFFENQSSYGCAAELLFGGEYWNDQDKRRFLQLQVGFPTLYFSSSMSSKGYVPVPILSYGFIY